MRPRLSSALTANECFLGDAREGIKQFIKQGYRVQTCVTSPPYFGLRSYDGASSWEGGNDPQCDHVARDTSFESVATRSSTLGLTNKQRAALREGYKLNHKERLKNQKSAMRTTGFQATAMQYRGVCKRCGAREVPGSQVGVEATPDEYVQALVDIFRLVRELLTDDGTVWLNIGDSYSIKPQARSDDYIKRTGGNTGINAKHPRTHESLKHVSVVPNKNLMGIPWRVAFALQADGWFLRSDIIWSKTSTVPEPVTDRPTKSHEYVFLLAKSAKYYYDRFAIADKDEDELGNVIALNNKRDVWRVAPEGYGSHVAVMPEKLVEPCVLAGSRPGDIVFDPFMGTGTVARVAVNNNRRWLGCELSPIYHNIIKQRVEQRLNSSLLVVGDTMSIRQRLAREELAVNNVKPSEASMKRADNHRMQVASRFSDSTRENIQKSMHRSIAERSLIKAKQRVV